MAVRILLGFLWLFALAALAGARMLPGTIDIYIKDRYFPVHKSSVILLISLLFVIPLLALTVWQSGSRRRLTWLSRARK